MAAPPLLRGGPTRGGAVSVTSDGRRRSPRPKGGGGGTSLLLELDACDAGGESLYIGAAVRRRTPLRAWRLTAKPNTVVALPAVPLAVALAAPPAAAPLQVAVMTVTAQQAVLRSRARDRLRSRWWQPEKPIAARQQRCAR